MSYFDIEEYELWCELNACPGCHGEGEGFYEDVWYAERGEMGMPWVCQLCNGTGIDPNAEAG